MAVAAAFGVATPWLLLLSIFAVFILCAAVFACGLVLVFEFAVQVKAGSLSSSLARILATVLCSIGLFLALARVSGALDDWLDLRSATDRLPAILREAEVKCSSMPNGYSSRDGGHYIVECGPPVRVAFDLGGGFLDNWHGLVFDPSGVVENARTDMRSLEPDPPDSPTRLFGGDIVWCRREKGDFFHCRFT
jgi:hypothetical protein